MALLNKGSASLPWHFLRDVGGVEDFVFAEICAYASNRDFGEVDARGCPQNRLFAQVGFAGRGVVIQHAAGAHNCVVHAAGNQRFLCGFALLHSFFEIFIGFVGVQ